MTLQRAAWGSTIFLLTLTAVLLLVSGYLGYGFVFLAVAACAAVNLF